MIKLKDGSTYLNIVDLLIENGFISFRLFRKKKNERVKITYQMICLLKRID